MTDSSPEFRDFVDQVGRAASDFVAGDPAPYRALWSDGADVSIFGGWGDYEIGWDQVGPRLEWAGARFIEGGSTHQEVLTMASSGDLGYTVSVERGTARLPGQTEPVPMVLRVTHVHRRIDGRWRVVHRHADPITEKTSPEAVLQDHAG